MGSFKKASMGHTNSEKFLLWLISVKHCSSSTTGFPHSSHSRIKISARDADDSKIAFMSLVIAGRKSLIRLSSSVQNKCFHLDDDARMPKQRLVNYELQKKPPKAMNRNGKFSPLRVRGRHLVWKWISSIHSLRQNPTPCVRSLNIYRARFFVHRSQLLLV